MTLIKEILENLRMEIRPNSRGLEYLEAVIRKSDLEFLRSLLAKHLGPAAKKPETDANLPKEIQRLVDSIGGLRIEQSFFYRQEANHKVLYAALWPWESDAEKTTLKVGAGSLEN